jgi:Pyruvate/2-oxoacid:ferredoxin oxidoreductase delta subunit
MILGRCGSGKSSILHSLLTQGYTYKNKSLFDEAAIWLGSKDSVDAFNALPIKNKAILHEFNPEDFEEYVEDLRKHQLERLSKNQRPLNIALIFDDFVGNNLLKHHNGKASPLERLALTSRHELNATIFLLSQCYKNTGFSSPSMRNNTTTYIIANMTKPEVEKIAEEHCNQYTPDQFIELYNEMMKSPFNFMVIDYRRPLDERITERFTGSLKSPLKQNAEALSDSSGSALSDEESEDKSNNTRRKKRIQRND